MMLYWIVLNHILAFENVTEKAANYVNRILLKS